MPPSRPAPSLPGLDDSPVAHIMLDTRGLLCGANPAAAALLGPEAVQAGSLPLATLGLPTLAGGPDPMFATTIGRWLRLARVDLANGRCLLAIEDAQAHAEVRAEAQRLETLLDIAGELGRLGTWSRDARDLQGRWDRHVFRMWGLDEADGTPDFERVAEAIIDEDRDALRSHFRASLSQPGTYDHRYRVRRPDGSIGQLHSQWEVRQGPDGTPAPVLGVLMDDTDAWRLARAHDVRLSEMALAEDLMDLSRWRHELRTQRMHYNRRSYDMLGIAPRPEGLSIDEVRSMIHPDDLARVLASAEQTLRTGEATDFEARYRHADGSWLEVINRRALERDALGNPLAFIGVSMDLTRIRQANRHSQAMTDRLELAARSAGIGYWSREPEQALAIWNPEMARIHGLPVGSPVPTFDHWLATMVHPQDREQVGSEFLRIGRDQRQEAIAEFRVVRPDGAVRRVLTHTRVEASTKRPNLFGVVIDVTERWHADLALQAAEERAALAARCAGIGTFEVDLATGQGHWDTQMWRLRGLDPVTDTPTFEQALSFLHPQDRERARRLVTGHQHAGDAVEGEFRVVWPDGQVRWLATRSSLVQSGPGQATRRIGINWDITEARQAEAERREREAAEQANRAKSAFLSRVSHELRTPMNAVLGFTQLMLAHADDQDVAARREQLQQVLGAGQHLLQLINDVLDLSAVEAGQLRFRQEAVPLDALLRATIDLVEPLRESHALPKIEVDTRGTVVMADPMRLRQVLLNLLSNAIKYNRQGGSIRVDAQALGSRVLLRVSDTGLGMTAAQMNDLFQPFNRLGNEANLIEGSGVGLAIAKAMIEHMGGSIEARSQHGSGSVFTVSMPAAEPGSLLALEPQAPAPHAPTSDPAYASGMKGTVLYVEDNPVNLLLVKEMLSRAKGLKLLEAIDGVCGVAMARHHRPDLVLVDMQLPDIDGFEVLRRLRGDPGTAALRCVALSANAMPDDVERARLAGFDDYWTKPLELTTFLASMQALLAGRRDDHQQV